MIVTVAFDADETLVDTPAAVTAALTVMVGDLGVPQVTVETFRADARDCWAEMPERSAREIREVATLRTLERYGLAHELDRMMEMFFEVRFANSRPFEHVLPTLATLQTGYRLGYATNANSEARRCGLAGQFAFEIYALRGGVPKKPAAGFYAAVAEAAGAEPAQVVYVGDTYEHDVAGPARFGMRTVWLNQHGVEAPGDIRPDAMISCISQLPQALARIGCGPAGQVAQLDAGPGRPGY
jgi:putative hydrolase of the HAD superfamily